jgi:hypothetical protein
LPAPGPSRPRRSRRRSLPPGCPRRRSLTARRRPRSGPDADGDGHARPARARSEAGSARKSPARTRSARRRRRQGARRRGRVKRTLRRPGTGQCRITVGTYPWSQLWIDGADTGQHTPVVDLPVACGNHKLEFKRRDLRISQTENVTLNEGREFRRQYELKGSDVDE